MYKVIQFVSLIVCIIVADPSISSLSGNIVEDSTLTITGTGFGTNNLNLLIYDDFDSSGYNDGDTIPSSPKIGSWNLFTEEYAYITTSKAVSGIKAIHSHRTSIYWSGFQIDNLSGLPRVYCSFWFSFVAHGTGQVKLFQMKGTQGGTCPDYHPAVLTGDHGGVGGAGWWKSEIALDEAIGEFCYWPNNGVNYTTIPDTGSWHFFELLAVQSVGDSTYNGMVRIAIDGEDQFNVNPTPTHIRTGEEWVGIQMLNGLTNFDSSHTWMDDIYVDTTFYRVIATDSSTISASTLWLIQQPLSWGYENVEIKLNLGSLLADDSVYFHIYDNNDSVSTYGAIVGATQEVSSRVIKTVVRR